MITYIQQPKQYGIFDSLRRGDYTSLDISLTDENPVSEFQIDEQEIIDVIHGHLERLNAELVSLHQGVQDSFKRMDRMSSR